MKLKPKLRHFWRNNKHCTGMWMMAYNAFVAIITLCIGLYLSAFIGIALSFFWYIVFVQEREIDARRRCHYVNKRRCKKYINEMHWRGLKEGYQVGYASGYDDGFTDASNKQENNDL